MSTTVSLWVKRSMLHFGNCGNREKRAQLRMKNWSKTMGLVVKFFTYFRDLPLKQSTQDPTNPNLMSLRCILLIMTASFFFKLFCNAQMECALEPRHHQDVPLRLSLHSEKYCWSGWGIFSVHIVVHILKSWLGLKRTQQRDGWDTWNTIQFSLAKLSLNCF